MMPSIEEVQSTLDRLQGLGIVEHVDGNSKYTKKFCDAREFVMQDPKVLKIVEDSCTERNITDDRKQVEELLGYASLIVIFEFAGGVLKDEDIETFSRYVNAMDKNIMDTFGGMK
jgi:uroporphyrinogen-III decarboxylase